MPNASPPRVLNQMSWFFSTNHNDSVCLKGPHKQSIKDLLSERLAFVIKVPNFGTSVVAWHASSPAAIIWICSYFNTMFSFNGCLKGPHCQKFSFRHTHCMPHRCEFWQATKTGDVDREGQRCRHTQRVIALRRNFWLERLTEERGRKKECWERYETRTPGWYYSLNWTLTVQTCCLEPVLNTRAQACSEAFWRPRESHSTTSWCLGRSSHCPVLSVKWQKCKLPWNAVKRSWRQPALKTCDDVDDWQGVSVEDFDGADDGESTTILLASGRGSLLWFGRSPAIPATDRRRWSGTAPACNRLSESISLIFCSL